MLKKSIISPVLGVLYLAVSVTGVMLFFHVRGGVIMTLHEWAGIFFVAAGALHLSLNWKLFTASLTKPNGMAAVCAAVVACLVFILAGGFNGHGGEDGGGGHSHSHSSYTGKRH